MPGDLGRRLAVAGLGIPVGIFLIYLGGWALGVTLALVSGLGVSEFYGLARGPEADESSTGGSVRTGPEPFRILGITAAVLLVLVVAHDPVWERLAAAGWATLVALVIVALGTAVFRRGAEGRPLASVSVTVAGVLYTAGTLVFALLIRHLSGDQGTALDPLQGTVLLAFPLTATWLGDSAAYFAGSRWGRRKLLPSVSPKKSVEGGIAGLMGSVLVGVLFGAFALGDLPVFAISPVGGAAIGLLIGIASQIGDLAESVLKRGAGVKDSGRLLPGHGGVLDRFDGIFVTLPLAYLLIVLNSRLGF